MIYQLLIRLLIPIILFAIIRDAYKRQGGWRYIKQRFGLGYSKHPDISYIWIHCASIGEVNAAAPLIEHLNKHYPAQHILVTTNTPTGCQFLENRFADKVIHVYCPLDYPFAIKRFLASYNVNKLWIMETEIWPNLYCIVNSRHIPISLLNARLSTKTLKAPVWLKNQYRQTFANVNQILCRSATEAERFISMGADSKKVMTLGNLKYANHFAEQAIDLPKIQQEYVVLASSHHPEELEICQLWFKLQRPELLIIVPRHSKRAAQIAKQLADDKIESRFYSDIDESIIIHQKQTIIVDQMGHLLSLLSQAKLVIMGGSFVNKGGHNILEPASFAKAIITGPDMSDFEDETAQLIAANGLIQCCDYQQLKQQLTQLLDNATTREVLGVNAQQFVAQQAEVLQRYLEALAINDTASPALSN